MEGYRRVGAIGHDSSKRSGLYRTAEATFEAVVMIGKQKLAEIKAEVRGLLARLPGKSPQAWLERRIASAKTNGSRDVETLNMLCAALERETSRRRKTKGRRKPAPH